MPREIRVVHIITTLERGGAEKAVVALAREQVRKYAEVTLVPLKGRLELAEVCFQSGIKIDTSLMNRSPVRQIFLFKEIVNNFNLVHAHLPRAELLAAIVSKPKSFVVTRHNSEIFFPKGGRLFSVILSRWISNKSKVVITISNTVKSFLVTQGELGKKANCVVIHYGIDVKRSVEVERKISNPIRMGSISRLVYQKNIPFLVELIALLKFDSRNVILEIVGEGQMRSEIIEKINASNLNDYVRLLGRTSHIEEFLSSLDIFILASRYEGFGLVLLEAISFGLPVMAPDIEIMREVLGDNHPGLYHPGDIEHCKEVFEKLVSNDEIRELCLRAQCNRLQLFSMNRYFHKHDEIYRGQIGLP